MPKQNSLDSHPVLILVAMAAWFGAVGYACFAGVGYVMGIPMTSRDWIAVALMAGTGVVGGAAAVFYARVRSHTTQ